MSRDDYRPSENQIRHHYKCQSCGKETEIESFYSADFYRCGGKMVMTGESYPADPGEWDEQRDPNGEWRPRRY